MLSYDTISYDIWLCYIVWYNILYVTILYKQNSVKIPGDFLGRLVLGDEDGSIKVFGATIF